jgi:hypothetical protein
MVEAVALALAAMEQHFPAWDLDINRHAMIHVAEACRMAGPPWIFTTFPSERFWGRYIFVYRMCITLHVQFLLPAIDQSSIAFPRSSCFVTPPLIFLHRLVQWMSQTVHPEATMMNAFRAFKIGTGASMRASRRRKAEMAGADSDDDDDNEAARGLTHVIDTLERDCDTIILPAYIHDETGTSRVQVRMQGQGNVGAI